MATRATGKANGLPAYRLRVTTSGSRLSRPGSILDPDSQPLPQGFTSGFEQRATESPFSSRSPSRDLSSQEHVLLDRSASPDVRGGRNPSEDAMQVDHSDAVPAGQQRTSASPAPGAAHRLSSTTSNSQSLPPPDACEGPEAAAEYEAYMQRWAAGQTLAQRWARLEASGKAVWLREEWEDHQLDMLLQQHCGNTPQAAAMWAAWPCVVDGAGTRAGTPRAKRRSREEAEGDAGGSPATEARRVRARTAPKTLQDFVIELPVNKPMSQDSVLGQQQQQPAAGDKNTGAAAAAVDATGAQAAAAAAAMEDLEDMATAEVLLSLHHSMASHALPEPQQVAAVSPAPQHSNGNSTGARRIIKIKLPSQKTKQQQQQASAVPAQRTSAAAGSTRAGAAAPAAPAAAAAAKAVARAKMDMLLTEGNELLQQIKGMVQGNAVATHQFNTNAAKFNSSPYELVRYLRTVWAYLQPESVEERKRAHLAQQQDQQEL